VELLNELREGEKGKKMIEYQQCCKTTSEKVEDIRMHIENCLKQGFGKERDKGEQWKEMNRAK
jgi:hypothetical protein